MSLFLAEHGITGTRPGEPFAQERLDGQVRVADRSGVGFGVHLQVEGQEPLLRHDVGRVRQLQREGKVSDVSVAFLICHESLDAGSGLCWTGDGHQRETTSPSARQR